MSSLISLVLHLKPVKCVFGVRNQAGSCRRFELNNHLMPQLNLSIIYRTLCVMESPFKWKMCDKVYSNGNLRLLSVTKVSPSCLEHLRMYSRFHKNNTDVFSSTNCLFHRHKISIMESNPVKSGRDNSCNRHYRGQARQKSIVGTPVIENSLTHQQDEMEKTRDEGDSNESNYLSVQNVQPRLLRKNVLNEFTRPLLMRLETKSVATEKRPVDEMSLSELSRCSRNIVPYVKRSPTLQGLVRLGVSLDKIQQVEGIPELLIKSNFQKDIVPFLKFLKHIGVPPQAFGDIFTRNPLLFKEGIPSLELRVGYLLSKKFSLEDVASMVVRAPIVLLMDPYKVDEKLGFLQNAFQLTGTEVRHVALTLPKILTWRQELIADVRFHVKEFIGFTDPEMKEVILKEPKVFLSSKYQLVKSFDYLHNTMMITHQHILTWPGILLTRLFIFKNRHLFLLSRGQAQYDPCLENFVPLKALGSGPDEEFCQKIAKCDVNEFYDFCKTL